MFIVIGATGRVGSGIVTRLMAEGRPVQAIVRSSAKAAQLEQKGITAVVADLFDADALKSAMEGGDTAFLVTPENPDSADVLHDAAIILQHYREAVQAAGIRRIVGLSSSGAQHASGTGNLETSYLLEHAFLDLDVETTFIRPSYYYSNWLGVLEPARQDGVLPTFLPADLKVPMIAPDDVSAFAAEVLTGARPPQPLWEITGPAAYSPADIAQSFSRALNRPVTAAPIPGEEWIPTMEQVGFTPSAAENFARMTAAVINGKTTFEQEPIRLPIQFSDYLRTTLAG